LPFNFDYPTIGENLVRTDYVEALRTHPPPEFLGKPNTISWGSWWEYWYTAVHRYPESVLSIQAKLNLLCKRLREPAK
jgi:hypothetical protein